MALPTGDLSPDAAVHVLRVPPNLDRLIEARRFVCNVIKPWGAQPQADAALLTSEVVGNAIVHAGGEVTVRVRRDGARALVEVHDQSAEAPEPQPPDARRIGGNGVRIIDALATNWGVTQIHGDGKIVWFEIPLPE